MIRVLVALFALTSIAPAMPSEALSYDNALEQIVGRSTDVGAQRAQRDSVSSATLPSRLRLLPTVSAFAEHSDSDDGTGRHRSLGLEANINLFRSGADVAAMKAAHLEIQTQDLGVLKSQLEIEGRAVESLNTFISQTLENQVLSRIVELRVASLATAEERFRRGYLAEQEALKVSVDLENDRAHLQESQITLTRAQAGLGELLGHHQVQIDWPWKEKIEATLPRLSARGLRSIQDRPDWRSEQSRIEAHQARAWEGLGKSLPSLDLSLRYGKLLEGVTPDPTFSGQRWSAGLKLTIPIFDGLENISTYSSERAQARASEQRLEGIRRKAQAEIEAELRNVRTALDTARARDRNLGVSRKLYSDNLQRFRRGLIDANALTIDQQRLFSSELLAIQGWSMAHSGVTRLCHAVGLRIKDCLKGN